MTQKHFSDSEIEQFILSDLTDTKATQALRQQQAELKELRETESMLRKYDIHNEKDGTYIRFSIGDNQWYFPESGDSFPSLASALLEL